MDSANFHNHSLKNIAIVGVGHSLKNIDIVGVGSLGITASGTRVIREGREFYDLFPITVGTDPIVNKNAEVEDTVHFIAKVVATTLGDTKKIAKALTKQNTYYTFRAIFDFFYKHYAYKLDKDGVEQVRRPARAWRDRKQGIDCDCFATSVSSILTNMGITHYLKVIAIKNRPNYQHIYVVIPKFKDADITKRSNYWVIDPVLNAFDQEAPEITKTDYLKMNGIPLQYLNGIDDAAVSGLGKEFDNLESSLNGIDDMEGLGYAAFKRSMHRHVKNTHRKIKSNPSSVEAVYNPQVLAGMYQQLDDAFSGTEEYLMGVLEDLSAREHLALQPRFQKYANAIHMHDDHLYGAEFGDVDEQMINAFSGLGKKGGGAAKRDTANKKAKAGPVTKIKNAVKTAKAVTKNVAKKTGAAVKKAATKTVAVAKKASAQTAKTLKKVGKAVVKYNPVSLAARAGFLVAMRTNFGMLAEKAYWAYQTKEFAISKGVTADYWNKCVQLLSKITSVFVGTLKGDSSALKKAILNGRAAKKVGKKLKAKGMQGLGTLMNFQPGMGAVAEASVTAAMAFLTPLLTFMSKLFKGKGENGEAETYVDPLAPGSAPTGPTVENENGTESPAPSPEASVNMNRTIVEANSPSATITENDGSVEAANTANDEPPSTEEQNFNSAARASAFPGSAVPPGVTSKTLPSAEEAQKANAAASENAASTPATEQKPEVPEVPVSPEPDKKADSKKGNGALILGAALLLGVGAAALSARGNKKKKAEKEAKAEKGLSGLSGKRTGKKSKKTAPKKKITLKAVTI